MKSGRFAVEPPAGPNLSGNGNPHLPPLPGCRRLQLLSAVLLARFARGRTLSMAANARHTEPAAAQRGGDRSSAAPRSRQGTVPALTAGALPIQKQPAALPLLTRGHWWEGSYRIEALAGLHV